jgi:uncharacterized protein (DUF4415 family)
MGKADRTAVTEGSGIDDAEDRRITEAALSDRDNHPLSVEDVARMRPVEEFPEIAEVLRKHGRLGRPPKPEGERKQRVTMYLDRDVVARLKEDGKGWQTRANAKLREALGL